MPELLTLQLTGHFAALDARGQEIEGLPVRGQAILAYLARRPGHAAPRAELAALLWGDRAEEQARASLRQELSLLRRALPEGALMADRSEVRLGPGAVVTAPPRPGAPLLDGFACPGAGFEDWLRDERQRDAEARTAGHLAEAAAALDAGDAAAARAAALQAMALDPDSEAALRLAMRAEFAAGDRGAALALHARFTERLRAELDAEPAAETEELARGIRAALAGAAPMPAAPTAGSRPTLAVLPFDYLATDPGDMLADGIVDEITGALSRVRDFHVIARQSAFALRDQRQDIRAAAARLGADYLVEGSVKRAGDRVRITVDLVAGTDARTLWSNRYDDRLGDLFDLQDRIAAQVAGQLSPNLRMAEIARVGHRPPGDRSAYDLVLTAYPHFWSHRKEDNRKALELFDAALVRDADYAVALAMKAWCHAQQVAYIWTDDPAAERGRAADFANRAAARATDHAPTLVAIGAALTLTTADPNPPRAFIDRALSIDPNNAWGWMRSGWLHCLFAQPERALADFARAEMLSPLDPFLFNILIGRANALARLGEIDEAITVVQRGINLAPGLTWAYRALAAYYGMKGDRQRSTEAAARFLEHYPGITIRKMLDSMPPSIQLTHPAYFDAMRRAGIPEE